MGKFTRPILADIYPRRRLFGMLDRIRGQPLVWISGPGGCGKTTLVASYLDERKIPCLWYQVDPGDQDPATFFHYLAQAAKRAFPKKKAALPAFTQDFAQGLPAFSQWYFEKIFDLLPPSHKSRKPQGDFILVFDNFQEVPEDSPLPEILLGGLSRIPEGVRVIVLSRSDPPPALVRLRANEEMGILAWTDLRLDLGETEGIIRLRNPAAGSAETVRQMHTASDGWTAGLILILQKAQRERAVPEILKNLGKEEIFEYFAGEIFRRADSTYQDFLLQTALFPRMTAGMAEELTGISSADQILSTLSRNNF
ncbi:MAG: hypothetical protein HXY45_03700, partial [Syntrophaceae bacterium]|nr:hypothetical protein [Syntrophaceae bacterium]